MALTQLIPTENWTKIINDNFGKTDLANLNWHKVSPGCTMVRAHSLMIFFIPKSGMLNYACLKPDTLRCLNLILKFLV